MCACVWQEVWPGSRSCSPTHTASHTCSVSLIAVTGFIRTTVSAFSVLWLCKMGHVSKCISTCGLMSLLTPFQPRSALKLRLFSTFEKYLPTPVSWLPSFLRRITILQQSWNSITLGTKLGLMLCLLPCLVVTSSSLDETAVRMEFNNKVKLQKGREDATVGHFCATLSSGQDWIELWFLFLTACLAFLSPAAVRLWSVVTRLCNSCCSV